MATSMQTTVISSHADNPSMLGVFLWYVVFLFCFAVIHYILHPEHKQGFLKTTAHGEV